MAAAPAHFSVSSKPFSVPAVRALSGFSLSGLLFSFLGAILPAWRHHLTQDYVTVGNYFLAMNLGIGAALVVAVTAAGVLLIGIFPGFLYNLAVNSVKIFPGL